MVSPGKKAQHIYTFFFFRRAEIAKQAKNVTIKPIFGKSST